MKKILIVCLLACCYQIGFAQEKPKKNVWTVKTGEAEVPSSKRDTKDAIRIEPLKKFTKKDSLRLRKEFEDKIKRRQFADSSMRK